MAKFFSQALGVWKGIISWHTVSLGGSLKKSLVKKVIHIWYAEMVHLLAYFNQIKEKES